MRSEQALPLARAAVPRTAAGGAELGRSYWREVERATARLVRVHDTCAGVSLDPFGRRPTLLRLSRPRVRAGERYVVCAYGIEGGLLARGAGGTLLLAQLGGAAPELCVRVSGYRPRFAPSGRRGRWTGTLYHGLQARAHRAVARRFLRRLAAGGAR